MTGIQKEQVDGFVLLTEGGSRDMTVTLHGTVIAQCHCSTGEVHILPGWQSRKDDIQNVTRGWMLGLKEYPVR